MIKWFFQNVSVKISEMVKIENEVNTVNIVNDKSSFSYSEGIFHPFKNITSAEKKKKIVFKESEETTAVNMNFEIDQEYTIEIEKKKSLFQLIRNSVLASLGSLLRENRYHQKRVHSKLQIK